MNGHFVKKVVGAPAIEAANVRIFPSLPSATRRYGAGNSGWPPRSQNDMFDDKESADAATASSSFKK
jgi:hypothetical protein